MKLSDQVVVITGGSTGIGRATAQLLAGRGAKLVLTARRADRLDATVRALRESGAVVIGIPADVGELDQVQAVADAAFGEFGRVDVGFFNAGIPASDRVLDPDLATWRASIDTNIYGLLHCIKAFLPRMLAQGTPCSVLATTSGAGIHGTAYRTAPYAMTKSAQLSIMESLYGQARDEGLPLHVGVVVPPLTRTNLVGDDLSVWKAVEDGLSKAGAPSALIEPEEFAHVIADGIEDGSFWIEADADDDERYFGGRYAAMRARSQATVAVKARAMSEHRPPDRYLW